MAENRRRYDEDEPRIESIKSAFKAVYNRMGYGLLERVYAAALEYELQLRGHRVDREISVPFYYRGKIVAWCRMDMVVDNRVVIEVKASAKQLDSDGYQLFTYLRSTRFNEGLLLHFGPKPWHRRFRCHTDPSIEPAVNQEPACNTLTGSPDFATPPEA